MASMVYSTKIRPLSSVIRSLPLITRCKQFKFHLVNIISNDYTIMVAMVQAYIASYVCVQLASAV